METIVESKNILEILEEKLEFFRKKRDNLEENLLTKRERTIQIQSEIAQLQNQLGKNEREIDEDEKISTYRNFDIAEGIDTSAFLQNELQLMRASQNEPIDLSYHVGRHTVVQKLYYKDSKIFSELKVVLDDLIKSFFPDFIEFAKSPYMLPDNAINPSDFFARSLFKTINLLSLSRFT